MKSISQIFNGWMEEGRLLFVTVVIKKKGRRVFYGRILHFSLDDERVLFYNEDTASTESYLLIEIDNIEPAELLS